MPVKAASAALLRFRGSSQFVAPWTAIQEYLISVHLKDSGRSPCPESPHTLFCKSHNLWILTHEADESVVAHSLTLGVSIVAPVHRLDRAGKVPIRKVLDISHEIRVVANCVICKLWIHPSLIGILTPLFFANSFASS